VALNTSTAALTLRQRLRHLHSGLDTSTAASTLTAANFDSSLNFDGGVDTLTTASTPRQQP
jgi:hypothetical protein